MKNGGKRAGAGKPKGYRAPHTLEAQEIKKVYVEMAREHGLPVAHALLKKALTGDVAAIKEFNDRAYGKVQQSVDVTTGGDKFALNDNQYAQLIRSASTRSDSN